MLMGQSVFVALLITTLSTATSGPAANSCTVSLPAVHGREDECPASGGGDFVNEINQNSSALLQEVVDECSASGGGDLVNEINQNSSALLQEMVHCRLQLGRTREHSANPCTELAEREPDIPSGNYWILNSTQSPVQVFCEMGGVCT